MANRAKNGNWTTGKGPYREWLAKLTPAERIRHDAERLAKREMKKQFQALVQYNQVKWLTDLNNALAVAMKRAVEEGNIDNIEKIAKLLGISFKDVTQEVTVQQDTSNNSKGIIINVEAVKSK